MATQIIFANRMQRARTKSLSVSFATFRKYDGARPAESALVPNKSSNFMFSARTERNRAQDSKSTLSARPQTARLTGH